MSTTATRQPLAGAHIGSSVLIKGELSGREDLYLDGEVEGTIELRECSLTVGNNGRVRGNVHGKTVIIQGKVEGDISANQRVELRNSAVVTGDITTERLVIEDGAVLKGKVETAEKAQKEKAEAAHTGARPQAQISSSTNPSPTGGTGQASFLNKA